MIRLVVAVLLVAGCALPGYQGGPPPRSTQHTYPGRALNPDTGLPHSPVPTALEATEGGSFAYGLVFEDGSTASSVERFPDFAACELGRQEYRAVAAARVMEGASPVMTTRCFRAHETPTAVGGR